MRAGGERKASRVQYVFIYQVVVAASSAYGRSYIFQQYSSSLSEIADVDTAMAAESRQYLVRTHGLGGSWSPFVRWPLRW